MAEKLPARRIGNADMSHVLTRGQALKLTERIAERLDQAWALLEEAHERQVWKVLGYTSWATYVGAEFHVGRSRSYQLLDQAKVIAALTEAAGQPVEVSESDARALKPVIQDAAAAVAEAITEGRATDLKPVIKAEVAKARVHKGGQPLAPDLHVSPKAAPKPAQQLSLWEERETRPLMPSRPPASDEEAAAAKALGRQMFEWGAQRDPKPVPAKRSNPYVAPPKHGARTAPSARPKAKAEKCPHPITRRIGDGCGACGEKVGGK